jgi:anaerobic ribonucleoside-triphosphate reductase activating protein
MNILATQYSANLRSLDIYVAGCIGNPHCEGCHNPESWNFNQGTPYTASYFDLLAKKIRGFDRLIRKIMIFGGEPLDQNREEFLNFLVSLTYFHKEIWLFTRYELSEVPKEIKQYCNYIKCGRYDETKKQQKVQYGITLATTNQKIYKRGYDY